MSGICTDTKTARFFPSGDVLGVLLWWQDTFLFVKLSSNMQLNLSLVKCISILFILIISASSSQRKLLGNADNFCSNQRLNIRRKDPFYLCWLLVLVLLCYMTTCSTLYRAAVMVTIRIHLYRSYTSTTINTVPPPVFTGFIGFLNSMTDTMWKAAAHTTLHYG